MKCPKCGCQSAVILAYKSYECMKCGERFGVKVSEQTRRSVQVELGKFG